jgi:hypothetical protein
MPVVYAASGSQAILLIVALDRNVSYPEFSLPMHGFLSGAGECKITV